MQEEKMPKVSVCVITYNHEKYIRQCLQSIVDQETNFDFEVIIADDFSTDGTRAIVQQFAEKYPTVIRTMFQETNTGGTKNFIDVHEAAKGEYIAHIDGDDYALPGKLQAQANYLDVNPECNIVWHRMIIHDESTGDEWEDCYNKYGLTNRYYNLFDMLNFVAIGLHSSKMYRNTSNGSFRNRDYLLDFDANVEQIKNGYAAFVGDKCFGVYRINSAGTISQNLKTRYLIYKSLSRYNKSYTNVKPYVNSAALRFLISDLRARRRTALTGLAIFFQTFSLKGILIFIETLPLLKGFNLLGGKNASRSLRGS